MKQSAVKLKTIAEWFSRSELTYVYTDYVRKYWKVLFLLHKCTLSTPLLVQKVSRGKKRGKWSEMKNLPPAASTQLLLLLIK